MFCGAGDTYNGKRLPNRGKLSLSKKVCSPLGPLCEGAPPAGGGGENCTAVRNISGYGKVLSLRPFGAPLPLWRKRHLPVSGESVSQREVFETLKRLLHKEKIQVQQPLYG